MPETLEKRVIVMLKLESNRSQGEWKLEEEYIDYGIDTSGYTITSVMCGDEIICQKIPNDSEDCSSPVEIENQKFIAHAPQMVELIRDQQRRINELEKRLKNRE